MIAVFITPIALGYCGINRSIAKFRCLQGNETKLSS